MANFHQSTCKSQNGDFDGILLSKVENIWAYNLQGSYVSWESRMTQKLKRNWLLSSKLAWTIWRILIQALKNLKILHFNGLTLMGCLWSKYIMFDPKKYKGVIFDSTEYWCKIWRKTDFFFQKWYEEFGKFSPETWKPQNFDFDGILSNPK